MRGGSDQESLGGERPRDPGGSTVADKTMVGAPDCTEPQENMLQTQEEQSRSQRCPRQHSAVKQKPAGGLPFFARLLLRKGFDKATVALIMDAWRPSTKKLYSTYLNKWAVFCVERGINPVKPTLPQACRFLRTLADKGSGYAALNSARCSLSTILEKFEGYSFGTHPLVCWLVKGGYERNPPKPRYNHFWDVNVVFDCLKSWGANSGLTLKRLSFKLTILLLLVSSQRGQTIVHLDTEDMEVSDRVVFKMKVLLKHNRVGDPLDSLIFRPFGGCKRLCVVRALKAYLKRTATFRTYSQLLLSFARPHGPISRDTLSRWTLEMLKVSGIDTERYKGHSTRGASTSAARRLGVPLNLILRQASWKSADSFARFYDKELDKDHTRVAEALLNDAL